MPPSIIDTDVFSNYHRQRLEIKRRVEQFPPGELAITTITVLEVLNGWNDELSKSKKLPYPEVEKRHSAIADAAELFGFFGVVSYSSGAMRRFEVLSRLKPSLNVAGPDLRIGCIALELGLSVITHNESDFKRIPGLTVIGWPVPSTR